MIKCIKFRFKHVVKTFLMCVIMLVDLNIDMKYDATGHRTYRIMIK